MMTDLDFNIITPYTVPSSKPVNETQVKLKPIRIRKPKDYK